VTVDIMEVGMTRSHSTGMTTVTMMTLELVILCHALSFGLA
jgi:hypothetical protein